MLKHQHGSWRRKYHILFHIYDIRTMLLISRFQYDTTGVSKPNPPPKPKGKPDAGDLLGDVSQGISGPQQKHNIGGH